MFYDKMRDTTLFKPVEESIAVECAVDKVIDTLEAVITEGEAPATNGARTSDPVEMEVDEAKVDEEKRNPRRLRRLCFSYKKCFIFVCDVRQNGRCVG